jgi:TolB-like protein/Tfp pilus assembly protein PilF
MVKWWAGAPRGAHPERTFPVDGMRLVLLNGRTVDLQFGSVTDAAGQVATLRPQAVDVLKLLAARPGALVTKDELMQAVWPGIAVTDDSLVQCIREIRQAIGDDQHQVITTVVKRGYVLRVDASPQTAARVALGKGPEAKTGAMQLQVPELLVSIAVLPFKNLSSNAEQEFFVDGLTEDLITELSKVPGLFVIASHSCFTFKSKPVDIRQAAQELGVRYIVEGSARRGAERIRINAQLIDAHRGGSHLWADRFDRDVADVFAVQDEVVARIIEALLGKLAATRPPARKPTKFIEAYDLLVRGRFLWQRTVLQEGKEARKSFEQAIAIDPDYAEAHAFLALTHWMGWVNWFEPEDPHRRLAIEIAERAVALDPNDAIAHQVLGHVLAYERKYEESAEQIEMALRVDPNNADVYAMRTDLLVMNGQPQEAIESIARAMRLNPRPPAWYYWLKGEAEYAARDYLTAISTLRHEATYGTPSRSILAAALAQLGRSDEARIEARLFMADYPDFRIEAFLDTQPFRNLADRELFAEGYRKAGVPE